MRQGSYIYRTRMKHSTLRLDKNCLNCGHEVPDRFCPHCGQENLELRDSAVHLVLHYIQDLVHYDGRLWHTLRSLILRPGSAAEEYLAGKRQANLEPIRFYVFASTVFFILLYVTIGSFTREAVQFSDHEQYSLQKRMYQLRKEKDAVAGTPDTTHVNALIETLQRKIEPWDSLLTDSIISEAQLDAFAVDTSGISEKKGLNRWLIDKMSRKGEEMREKSQGDPAKALAQIGDELLHALPKLLFLSLPFFALLLKLFYLRSFRRLYVDHFIFSIYLYAYFFTLYIAWMLLQLVISGLGWAWPEALWGWVITILSLYPFIYLLLAMRRFYRDRWWSLGIRFFFLVMTFSFAIVLLFFILAVITVIF